MSAMTQEHDDEMDMTKDEVKEEAAQAIDPAVAAEAEVLASLAAAMGEGDVDDEAIITDDQEDARLAELEAENVELRDKVLRATAEVENMRRRTEREKQEASKFAVTNFARDMISVFENLTRASTSISEEARKADQQLGNLAMGVDMTLGELTQAFGKHKIVRIDPIGQPFDHNFHQAMKKVETDEHPEGTVVQVLQAAYTIHERLLQPALVAVATPPAQDGDQGDAPAHVDTKA